MWNGIRITISFFNSTKNEISEQMSKRIFSTFILHNTLLNYK